MKRHLFIGLVVGSVTCSGQAPLPALIRSRTFIDRVEVFVGRNLSFNNGNKFLENYTDEYITNKRLAKPGFTLGVGAYHTFSEHVRLNIRLQYEEKGRKTELDTPLIPDDRRMDRKDYTYGYFALSLAPQVYLGRTPKLFLSAGGYYGKIQRIRAHEEITSGRGETFFKGKFQGRFFEDLNDTGGVSSITWSPGLRSFRDYDGGIIMSAGYDFWFGKGGTFTVQLMQRYGLTNINKESSYGQEERMRSVELLVGYSWRRTDGRD